MVPLTLAEFDPEGATTDDGNARLDELSERATVTPPLGAALLRRTAQLMTSPDNAVAGSH
jgi:hypothetical protein